MDRAKTPHRIVCTLLLVCMLAATKATVAATTIIGIDLGLSDNQLAVATEIATQAAAQSNDPVGLVAADELVRFLIEPVPAVDFPDALSALSLESADSGNIAALLERSQDMLNAAGTDTRLWIISSGEIKLPDNESRVDRFQLWATDILLPDIVSTYPEFRLLTPEPYNPLMADAVISLVGASGHRLLPDDTADTASFVKSLTDDLTIADGSDDSDTEADGDAASEDTVAESETDVIDNSTPTVQQLSSDEPTANDTQLIDTTQSVVTDQTATEQTEDNSQLVTNGTIALDDTTLKTDISADTDADTETATGSNSLKSDANATITITDNNAVADETQNPVADTSVEITTSESVMATTSEPTIEAETAPSSPNPTDKSEETTGTLDTDDDAGAQEIPSTDIEVTTLNNAGTDSNQTTADDTSTRTESSNATIAISAEVEPATPSAEAINTAIDTTTAEQSNNVQPANTLEIDATIATPTTADAPDNTNLLTILIVLGIISILALIATVLLRRRSGSDAGNTEEYEPTTELPLQQSSGHRTGQSFSDNETIVATTTPEAAAQTTINPPVATTTNHVLTPTRPESDSETLVVTNKPSPVSADSDTAITTPPAQSSPTDRTAINQTAPGPQTSNTEDDFSAFDRSIIEKRWAKLNEADDKLDGKSSPDKK